MKNHFSNNKYVPIIDYVEKTHPGLNLNELMKKELNTSKEDILENIAWSDVEFDQLLMNFFKKHTKSPKIAIQSAMSSRDPKRWGKKSEMIKGDESLKQMIEMLSPCVSRMSSFVDIELIEHKCEFSRFMAFFKYEFFEDQEKALLQANEQEILEVLAGSLASIPNFKKDEKFDVNYSFEDYVPGEHSFFKILHKKQAA